jgi:hypothetical protein
MCSCIRRLFTLVQLGFVSNAICAARQARNTRNFPCTADYVRSARYQLSGLGWQHPRRVNTDASRTRRDVADLLCFNDVSACGG